ncbi:hypothetical protein ACFW6C_04165 [Streptomyces fungicidicus]|uniref:hypothetical protein n=1 Tax=Streptomyces fungicidicus TaxID=68203 RepID=UPI0036AFD54C
MSMLRDAVKAADASGEISDDVKENLTLLMELAESKCHEWLASIEKDLASGKMGDDLYIPITRVVRRKTESRSTVAHDVSNIASTTAQKLSALFGGETPILTTIGGLVEDAFREIMGAGVGKEQDVEVYSVIAEDQAIVRYDFAFWGRNIKTQSLLAYMETVSSCVVVRSAVDCKKLEFNEFLSVYGPVLSKAYPDVSQRKDKLKEAQDIYEKLSGHPVSVEIGELQSLTANAPSLIRVGARSDGTLAI